MISMFCVTGLCRQESTMTEKNAPMVDSKKKEDEKVNVILSIWNFLRKSKSKAVKAVGGGLLGGGGVLALLITYVNAQDNNLNAMIASRDKAVREIIDLKHVAALDKIGNLKTGMDKILKAFSKLDDRMYKAALRAAKQSK